MVKYNSDEHGKLAVIKVEHWGRAETIFAYIYFKDEKGNIWKLGTNTIAFDLESDQQREGCIYFYPDQIEHLEKILKIAKEQMDKKG